MKENRTASNNVLLMMGTLAAILVTIGTVETSLTQLASAQSISIPTNTTQQASCDTAGSSSAIADSCNSKSTNNIANSGGVIDLTQPSTNTGTITVIKHVINDNSGTLQASDFTMTISTCPPNAQDVRQFPGRESGTTVAVDPAPCYNVGESFPGPIPYDISLTGDCTNVVLNAGDHKTCTITNNDRS
jgi:hypothetical protein